MINLIFTLHREIFRIKIDNKAIWYSDKKWKNAVRIVPKDDLFSRKILFSRNKIPKHLAEEIMKMFELTDEEKKEYDAAETEEELAEICIKDCGRKGAMLLKKEKI